MAESAINQFLRGFVTPMIVGGPVHVEGILSPGDFDALVSGPRGMNLALADAQLMANTVAAARANLARVGPTTDFVTLGPDTIGLCAAWHNLLAATHPDVASSAKLRGRVRDWTSEMLEWVGPPRTAQEAALRHATLARLGELGRVDTEVKSLFVEGTFIGVAPPKSLSAWKSVRRIEHIRTRHDLFALLSTLEHDSTTLDLLPLAKQAIALSPLTDLSLCDRPDLPAPFLWSVSSLAMLTDAPLRGAALRIVLTPGPRASETVAHRVQALERATLLAADPRAPALPPMVARLLLDFHLELLMSDALAQDALPRTQPLALDALLRLGVDRVADRCRISPHVVVRALGLQDRPLSSPPPNGPATALLARAGLSEASP